MEIIDISRGIFSSELYPATLPPSLELTSQIARGDNCNCSTLTLDLHTATHVDAESHFFADGQTIDRMPLERYVGLASVVDCNACPLETLPAAGEAPILLLKNAPFLTPDDCRSIIAKGYRTIGTDRLSPSSPDDEAAVHHLLLGCCIGLIETLDLSLAESREYLLAAQPLRIEGAEASPVRAILIAQ